MKFIQLSILIFFILLPCCHSANDEYEDEKPVAANAAAPKNLESKNPPARDVNDANKPAEPLAKGLEKKSQQALQLRPDGQKSRELARQPEPAKNSDDDDASAQPVEQKQNQQQQKQKQQPAQEEQSQQQQKQQQQPPAQEEQSQQQKQQQQQQKQQQQQPAQEEQSQQQKQQQQQQQKQQQQQPAQEEQSQQKKPKLIRQSLQGQQNPSADQNSARGQAESANQDRAREAVQPLPERKPQPTPPPKPLTTEQIIEERLVESSACGRDVERHCPKPIQRNNFEVIKCFQSSPTIFDSLSHNCQAHLWRYKWAVSVDPRFENAARSVCAAQLQSIPECKQIVDGTNVTQGRLLTCALQNLARIKAFQPKAGVVMAPHTLASCVVLLERLVIVVFPDFGYVAHFLEHCKPAIERFHCGQPLLPPSAEAPADTLGTLHSQAKTVDCLMMQVRRLEPECRTQVVRLGEVQANDWARDRSFFYACQHDREALCPGVVAGEGQVYKCLTERVNHPKMSGACREQISKRLRLAVEDVRAYRPFWDSCRADLRAYHCGKSIEERARKRARQSEDESRDNSAGDRAERGAHEFLNLSIAIACLGQQMSLGRGLQPACIQQIRFFRRTLFTDYQLNPRLVLDCENEIAQCESLVSAPAPAEENGNGASSNQKAVQSSRVLHCLMKYARALHTREAPAVQVSPVCQNRLRLFLRKVDPMEDIELDPVLYGACEAVIKTSCREYKERADREAGGRGDAQAKRAHADEDEAQERQAQRAPAKASTKPSSAWAFECLLDKLDDKDKNSQQPVVNADCRNRLLEVEYFIARDFKMDRALYSACALDARDKCKANLPQLKAEMEKAMAEARKVAAEQVQKSGGRQRRAAPALGLPAPPIGQPPDESPEEDIEHTDLVLPCLFGQLDTLRQECQAELKRVMRQRAVSARLLPELELYCVRDLGEHCSEDQHIKDGGELQCLQEHLEELQKQCREAIVKFTNVEEQQPTMNRPLMKHCGHMIRKHCGNVPLVPKRNNQVEPASDVLSCLVKHKNDPTFGSECHIVVEHHQRLRSKDRRLSPLFERSCAKDVRDLCANWKPDASDEEPKSNNADGVQEGNGDGAVGNSKARALECLSAIFTEDALQAEADFGREAQQRRAKLRSEGAVNPQIMVQFNRELEQLHEELVGKTHRIAVVCRQQLSFEMFQQAENAELDPVLMRHCEADIKRGDCNQKKHSQGELLECLRVHFEELEPKCHNVVFKRDLRQMLDSSVDYGLRVLCDSMRLQYCANEAESSLFVCLKRSFRLQGFDQKCRNAMIARDEMAAHDIRLQPGLMAACISDIENTCSDQLQVLLNGHRTLDRRTFGSPNDVKSEWIKSAHTLRGTVINCLRSEYARTVSSAASSAASSLTGVCKDKLRLMIRESVLRFHLDPVLRQSCQADLLSHCKDEIENPVFLSSGFAPPRGMARPGAMKQPSEERSQRLGGQGASSEDLQYTMGVQQVHECLKQKAKSSQLTGIDCKREVLRLLSETLIDVQSDQVLYEACRVDLKAVCEGVPVGMGQQVRCLMDALRQSQAKPGEKPGEVAAAEPKLSASCQKMLSSRAELWKLLRQPVDGVRALPRVAPESLGQLVGAIAQSPRRSYLLLWIGGLVLGLCLCGCCCGHISRRLRYLFSKKIA